MPIGSSDEKEMIATLSSYMLISFVNGYLSFGSSRILRSYFLSSAWTFLPASSAVIIPLRWIFFLALFAT